MLDLYGWRTPGRGLSHASVSMVSWVSALIARAGRSSATKATEETDLHPDVAGISTLAGVISTPGMTTKRVS